LCTSDFRRGFPACHCESKSCLKRTDSLGLSGFSNSWHPLGDVSSQVHCSPL
jgi:hypothetical protein